MKSPLFQYLELPGILWHNDILCHTSPSMNAWNLLLLFPILTINIPLNLFSLKTRGNKSLHRSVNSAD